MKRLILPFFLLFAASYASAQCTVGKTATSIYDDYSSATEPSGPNGGVYFATGASVNSNVRDNANGELDLVLTQAYGDWVPFGIDFGTDGSSNPYTIDLSGDASYSVTVRNDDPSVTVRLRIAVRDIDGDQIDTDVQEYTVGAGAFGEAWKYYIDIAIAPNETKTLTANVPNGSNGVALTGSFDGGAYTNWNTSSLEQNVDYSQIQGFFFFATNNAQNPSDGYKHYGFANLSLSILDIQVGACPLSIFGKTVSDKGISIVPNPVSDLAKVSYTIEAGSNVKVNVSDILGNLVKTVEGSFSAADINVADLNKGIYFVTVVADGIPVSSQKLIVE